MEKKSQFLPFFEMGTTKWWMSLCKLLRRRSSLASSEFCVMQLTELACHRSGRTWPRSEIWIGTTSSSVRCLMRQNWVNWSSSSSQSFSCSLKSKCHWSWITTTLVWWRKISSNLKCPTLSSSRNKSCSRAAVKSLRKSSCWVRTWMTQRSRKMKI